MAKLGKNQSNCVKTVMSKKMGSRPISEYIWMPKNLPNEYLNVFKCPTKDQTNIKIYSVLGKATITNTNNICGSFRSYIGFLNIHAQNCLAGAR